MSRILPVVASGVFQSPTWTKVGAAKFFMRSERHLLHISRAPESVVCAPIGDTATLKQEVRPLSSCYGT